MSRRRHPHLYELSAWPWLERLSRHENRRVTLADVPDGEWDALAGRGFDLVFLMGVWQRSAIGREIARTDPALRAEYDRILPDWTAADVPGSPYCVADYVPDERMGGWCGLDTARRELNSRGIGLVLDFVPNHTAFDHPWVNAHPERYVLGTADDYHRRPGEFREIRFRGAALYVACGRDPYFPPWTDVAQLNYSNPGTREVMIAVLRELAAHCDAVRCDMAMLVLNDVFERTWRDVLRDSWLRLAPIEDEFWPEAIRSAPTLIFIAEAYWDMEWTLQQYGFHFTYDKRLLDRLRHGPVADVRAHLTTEASYGARLVRFLENHDEPRSAAVFRDRLPAAATLLTTVSGLRFFFDGQLEGARLRSPVQLGQWPVEPTDPTVADLYGRLLSVACKDLFHEGDWKLLEVSSAGDGTFSHLLAYRWRLQNEFAVVVINLGSAIAHGYVSLTGDLPEASTVVFADRLADQVYERSRESLMTTGLYVRLDGGRAHLLLAQ